MAKNTSTKAAPRIGAESLQIVARIAHELSPQVRAGSGIATALHALYAAKLEEAEADYERLGKSCSDDGGRAYGGQGGVVQDLRGLVAILATLDRTLAPATRRTDRIAELTRRCRGADQ